MSASSEYSAAPLFTVVMVMVGRVMVVMVGRVVMVWEGPMVMVVMMGVCEGRRVEVVVVVVVTVVMVVMPVKEVLPFVVNDVSLVPQLGGGSKVAVMSLLHA